jgi:hypothetical protein
MGDTRRLTIRNAFEDALNGDGIPDAVTIVRARKRPSVATELPLIMVVIGKELVIRANKSPMSPVVQRGVKIGLDCWVTDPESQDALEPLVAWGTKAIIGSGLLGGLARDITEDEILWDLDMLEQQFGRATQWFTVWYTTKANDQELKQ